MIDESALNEMNPVIEELNGDFDPPKPPMCHRKPMKYCAGDSDDLGNFEEWFECDYCGHTKDV
jgi:hypothetical protein